MKAQNDPRLESIPVCYFQQTSSHEAAVELRRWDIYYVGGVYASSDFPGIETPENHWPERPDFVSEKLARVGTSDLSRRRNIAGKKRYAVFARAGFKCLHCGSSENLTIDHIYPFALGGTDDDDNLQCLCRTCNCRKGAKL